MTLRRSTVTRADPALDRAPTAPDPRTALLPPDGPPAATLAQALLVLAVVLVPITWGTVLWSSPGGELDFNRRVTMQLFDLALVLGGVAQAAALASAASTGRSVSDRVRSWRRRPLPIAVSVLGLWGAVALVVHPSPRGAEWAARLVLGALTMHAIVSAPATWFARLRVATVVTACAQSALAIAQSAHGAPFGWRWLEFDGPLYVFGSSTAGRGGLTHPYHLAFVIEVGIVAGLVSLRRAPRPQPWLAAIAVCGAGLGVTYSRAAAIGIVGTAVALLWPRRTDGGMSRRLSLMAAAALLAGVAVTGVAMGSGWYTRTTESTNLAGADSGRLERAREAFELIGDHPITGVGPGRYSIEIDAHGNHEPLPAHNVVLHVAAEAGVLAGVAVAIVGLLLTLRYLSSSREVGAAFILVVPYFVFDAYPYIFPVGLFLSAVWLGLLETARAR